MKSIEELEQRVRKLEENDKCINNKLNAMNSYYAKTLEKMNTNGNTLLKQKTIIKE